MTSMKDQFEFIIRSWVNNPEFKEPSGTISSNQPTELEPNAQSGGHDPIIGQNNKTQDRIREFTVSLKNAKGKRVAVRVNTNDGTGKGLEWVIPTGGDYFFSPSIRALRDNLSDV